MARPRSSGGNKAVTSAKIVGHDQCAAGGLERTKQDQLLCALRPSRSQSTGCIEKKSGAEYFSDSDEIRQSPAG
jgi:hypothetical protein